MSGALDKPHAIHWRINSVCNRVCPFCYGPEKLHEDRLEASLPILERMIAFGIDTFILTGGEPLMSKKVDPVIRFLHANGAKVVLYTNCDFWDEHDEVLRECLDTVCVPIEGSSEKIHDFARGKNNMRAVLSVLDRYANGGGPFKVKVGTVLGRHNLHELPAILYLLDKYKINVWKLYDYIRYNDRTLQKQWEDFNLGITDAEYRFATQALLTVPGRKTPLGLSSEYDRDQSYFMLNPDLDIIVPMRGEDGIFFDKVICNARDTSMRDIESLWKETIDWDRYVENLSASLF
jgi:MoaA/NifB/PqqE/SkfB family radical SAM enzyme